jgi:hypothetical protein
MASMKSRKAGFVLVLLAAGVALWWTLRQTQFTAHHDPAVAQGPSAPGAAGAPDTSVPTGNGETTSANQVAPGFAPAVDPAQIQEAWKKVEEQRTGSMGVKVPSELRHYPDRRRFLALQMANAQEEKIATPHDQPELCQMVLRHEMVEVPSLTDDLVLYRIGEDAREDPLTHWDEATNKDVPLFGSEEAWKADPRHDQLAAWYGDPDRAAKLYAEYQAVTTLASDFGGQKYDLTQPDQKRAFAVRLLHFARPAALTVIQQLAAEYHQKFDRRLPVSSLVRTDRYQRRLTRVNPNATHVDLPPHTTGLAFDVSYRYMAGDEQDFVMDFVARLEDEGKVETLRENRGHVHTYVFPAGHRPSDALVASLLDDVSASHKAPARASHGAGHAQPRRSSRRTAKK